MPVHRIWSYDALFRAKKLPHATWVFTDFDRLSAWELELAAHAYREIKSGGMRVLNDPALAVGRFDLLASLRLLGRNGETEKARALLRSFVFDFKDGGDLVLAARLAQSVGAHDLAISIADTADRRGAPLDLFNFPKDGLPADKLASVDKAAVYAVARQESRFRADAISSAGARGLMQLMPATARYVARRVGMTDFSPARVNELDVNLRLGTSYLRFVLDDLDGHPALASAASVFDNSASGRALSSNVLACYNRLCREDITMTHIQVNPAVDRSRQVFQQAKDIALKIVKETDAGFYVNGMRLGFESAPLTLPTGGPIPGIQSAVSDYADLAEVAAMTVRMEADAAADG